MAATNIDKFSVSPDCHTELMERFPVYHGWLQLLLVFVPQDLMSPRESRTPGLSCTPRNGNPMVSGQVSAGNRLLGLLVQTIFCQRCHSSGGTARSCGTNTSNSCSHPWNAGNLSKSSAWHNQAIHKSMEVGGCHSEHLLQVNKMVFTASISIVSFTRFLHFVAYTAYILLHISEI